eukprot:8475611-Karenia_brevis.AAC.1
MRSRKESECGNTSTIPTPAAGGEMKVTGEKESECGKSSTTPTPATSGKMKVTGGVARVQD